MKDFLIGVIVGFGLAVFILRFLSLIGHGM